MDSARKNVILLNSLLIAFLAILFATNPPGRNSLLTYMVFGGVIILFYSLIIPKNKDVIGLEGKNAGRSVFYGIVFGVGFFVATRFIPGFSLGTPLLPNAISDTLKLLIVVFIAPQFEEDFFRGALLNFFTIRLGMSEFVANLAQSTLFSLAHVGAWIVGFYDYSTAVQGFSAIGQNIAIFLSAGIFGFLTGAILLRKRFKNLWFSKTLHTIVNGIIFFKLAVAVPQF